MTADDSRPSNGRMQEIIKLRDELVHAHELISEQLQEITQLKTEIIKLKAQIESLLSKHLQLLEEKNKLEKKLTMKSNTALKEKGAKDQNGEVPINIEAKVIEVNKRNKLVSISAGTTDGVKSGHRFHVIRKEKYICDIVITAVDPDEAIGVWELSIDYPQVGDIVTNEL